MGESSTAQRGALPLKGLILAIFPPEMQKWNLPMTRLYQSPSDEILQKSGMI